MGVLILRDQLVSHIISEHVFRIVTYVCLGLCALALLLRSLVRITCFRRLLPEDYLMLFALAVLITRSLLVDHCLDDIYTLMRIIDNEAVPGPHIVGQLFHAASTYGVAMLLDTVGFWTIKLNFLLFFYRLAHQIRSYLIFWWVVLCLTIACGVVAIALLPYECVFTSDLAKLTTFCSQANVVSSIYTRYLASTMIDVVTDLMIISFPFLILWRSKISLHHKIVLSATFALVLVTVGATIVRGSMFGTKDVFEASHHTRHFVDMSWVLFWSFIEFVVSLIMACLISFRSLWTNKKGQRLRRTYPPVDKIPVGVPGYNEMIRPQTIGSPGVRKMRKGGRKKGWTQFYDSVLETCADLEGTVIAPETLPTRKRSIPLNRRTAMMAWVENMQPSETSDSDRMQASTQERQWTRLEENTEEESLQKSVGTDGGNLDTERLVQPRRTYVRVLSLPQDAGI